MSCTVISGIVQQGEGGGVENRFKLFEKISFKKDFLANSRPPVYISVDTPFKQMQVILKIEDAISC